MTGGREISTRHGSEDFGGVKVKHRAAVGWCRRWMARNRLVTSRHEPTSVPTFRLASGAALHREGSP